MIPKDCKRLAEVDFPIAVVSKHAAREKSIRHGHPSTLHLWWARRPLASSRAILLALLLPDPCDPHCPPDFKTHARELLPKVQGVPGPTDLQLREDLLKFIGDFANWDLAANPRYLEVSRALVKAAHGEEPPLVVDPFAGGGSIPLEALRLGCEAFASDLNPVACLILKVMLEDIPRHGPKLAAELRRIGAAIKRQAEEELADLYPKDPDGATPIAYLWARTVRCESPKCGAEIPLARSLWLCRKAKRKRALKLRIVRPAGETPRVEFEIFDPKLKTDVAAGTVMGAKGTCLACGAVLPPERVRAQLTAQRGGADVIFGSNGRRSSGARILAVVTLRPSERGRHYRLPSEADYEAVRKAHDRLALILKAWERGGKKGLRPVPDEPLNPIRPSPNARGLSAVTRYGMEYFGDLFTTRQNVALITLAQLAREQPDTEDGDVRAAMAMVVGRTVDYGSSGVVWAQTGEFVAHTFGRQALPIVWDFAEVIPWSDSSGNLDGAIDWVARVIEAWPGSSPGNSQSSDAADHPLPDETASVWFTDPPYYDAIPYADLSDFFFVWLRRVLPGERSLCDQFDAGNQLTPKARECVWNQAHSYEGRPKDGAFFEKTINRCFLEGRRVLRSDGIAAVVFAHQTTEGWEAFLGGLTRAGWTVTASWPIATERAARIRARNNASLTTSVHLICRPRPDDAQVGDWADVLRELPPRVSDWMERLQDEGVRGADLVFACIGPALEIYSRYSEVVDSEDREIPLGGDPTATEPHERGYLAYVWETVGRAALQQILGRDEGAGALEEDARLIALFLWALQGTNGGNGAKDIDEGIEEEEVTDDDEEDAEESPGRKPNGYTLIFDVVRRFAQPLGIHLPDWEGRIIETKNGVVRLLPVAECAKQLFGEDGAQAAADWIEREPASSQLSFFPEMQSVPRAQRGKRGVMVTASDDSVAARGDATTLDRVHVAMLLQSSGRASALRALLAAEQERGQGFLRLANALSALYPRESEEKRLLDAMLLAMPR